jgi:peptidoglycan/xylan/chitin deacetylase (PgdA/CDA1 family)
VEKSIGLLLLKRLYKMCADTRRKVLGPVTHFATTQPLVALTFDDGPNPEFTPRLLEVLKEHDAKATFFMVGEAAQRWPEVVRKVANEGHAIGNHSWDHARFPAIVRRERRAQIESCARALEPHGTRLFRPPFGSENLASHVDVRLLGYRTVNWSIGIPDWEDREADWIANGILQEIRPGCVILMHDGLYSYADARYLNREPTVNAVDTILRQMTGRFQFVTLPEMFQRAQPRGFGAS